MRLKSWVENPSKHVVNYNIAAKKKGDGITFLRKIVRGAADDSYGIEVAQLAGVPREVIKRAREILSGIESGGGIASPAPRKKETEPEKQGMMSFESFNEAEVCDRLRRTDLNTISPLEALNLVFDLKKILGN